MHTHAKNLGFTFIEVLVAMLIFATAVAVAVGIVHGAVRATRDSKEVSVATWLLQTKMVELETLIETKGMERGCEKKNQGKFPEPYQNYTWTTYCAEVDLQLSETAKKAQEGVDEGASDDEKQNADMQKLILDTVNDYISKALREIHVEVTWEQAKTPRTVSVTTHVTRYDLPISLPSL